MWFIKLGNVIKGPFSEDQLAGMLIRGEFSKSHLVSSDRQRWEQAGFLVDLIEKKLGAKSKPAAQENAYVDNSKKNWFYSDQGQQRGPLSLPEMERLVRERGILATTQVYSDQLGAWVNACDAPNFRSMFEHVPSAKSNWVALGTALVVTCTAIVAGLGIWIVINTKPSPQKDGDNLKQTQVVNDGVGSNMPPEPQPELPKPPETAVTSKPREVNKEVIASPSNIEDVQGAVGLVLTVMKTTKDKYLRISSGSAFLISKDGFMLTNKHVVDDCNSGMRLTIPSDDKDPAKARVYEGDIVPVVFLDGLQLQATMVHKSDQFDLAILKVDLRKPRRYFALSERFKLKVFDTVVAAGFPAVSSEPFKENEIVLKAIASMKAVDSPQETLLPRELIVKPTRSDFNRSFTDSAQELILEHSADISPGNSGGPLIDERGVVVGINTWVPSEKRTGGRSFLASEISQMRKIIDNFVSSNVVWVN